MPSSLSEHVDLDSSDRNTFLASCESYRASGRLDDALQVALRAEILWPESSRVGCALGFLYYDRNELDNAIRQFRRVIAREPANVRAHVGLGTSLLANADWKEGWKEFGWRRLLLPLMDERIYRVPMWDGKNARDGTLLLIGEGFGDTIQFCRYVPQVAKLCKKLIVICREEVKSLVAQQSSEVQVVSNWREVSEFDTFCLLTDVAGVLYANGHSRISDSPYITASRNHADLHDVLKRGTYRVGLAWKGDYSHFNDFRRSIDFEQLIPLTEVPEISLLGLQKDAGKDLPIINLGPYLGDFEDTAAVIENLDLVISIDSAVAHLAGAMGKLVWILLPYAAEWRWPRKGTSTYWYPSMRLFRQSRPGQWSDVIDEVQDELSLTLSYRKEKMTLAVATV